MLIVDDSLTSLKLIGMLVEKIPDCEVHAFDSPEKALAEMPDLDFDAAIIDYVMPGYNGVELLTEILRFEKYQGLPVIFVTADKDLTTRMDALDAGAVDFLTKPVNPVEFQQRVANIVALADAKRKLALQADMIRREVDDALLDMRAREEEIIHRLTLAASFKDPETASHVYRVGEYSYAIARALGLSANICADIRLTSPVHDLGKATAADTALFKQGRLRESEYVELQRATRLGGEIKDGAALSLLKLAADIAACHRERWDGQGYPAHLKGEEIPLAGRIVAIAGNFDALTSERPFKSAWPFEKAVAHIVSRSGSHFDPGAVLAFQKALPEIQAILFESRAGHPLFARVG
jgi:putative two-component system response regulator